MKRLFDILWLAALGVFVFAGMPIVTFHGDETYHIFNSSDYATLFIEHRPQDLLVYSLRDSDLAYHRLLDSGVARYTIGLAWHLAGMTPHDLPKHGYLFLMSYADNVARGFVPSAEALAVYRVPSTLFAALSVVVIFGIAHLYGGRRLAYLVSLLYTINPVVLLNGRRAMQEGSLLFFGLLTLYIALRIAVQCENGTRVRLRWWAALIVIGALALASKNSGLIYLAAGYLAIFIPEALRMRMRAYPVAVRLALCAALTSVLFVAVSPGLWSDPIARIRDVIDARTDAMWAQVLSDPTAPTTLEERAISILTEPFMMPLQHYELKPVAPQQEIDRYMASPFSGVQFGTIFGALLTILAIYGLAISAVPRLRLNSSWALAIGLYLWLAVNVFVLMTNPLPWQRYYLSLIPVVTLLSGSALLSLIAVVRHAPNAQPSYA